MNYRQMTVGLAVQVWSSVDYDDLVVWKMCFLVCLTVERCRGLI